MLKIIAMVKDRPIFKSFLSFGLLIAGLGLEAGAQMPSDTLVLVNEASAVSIEVANFYMEQRGIPERNRVGVSLPRYVLHPERPMPFDEFEKYMWKPILAHLEQYEPRHVQALLLSTDFPVRIDKRQSLSPMGASMALGRPWPQAVGKRPPGSNPYFVKDFAKTHAAFEWPPLQGGVEVFLPMMALGVRGIRANTRDEIMAYLSRSIQADYTAPKSEVWFASNGGVRSRARENQILPVLKALEKGPIRARIAYQYPRPEEKVMGIFTGAQKVFKDTFPQFLPGAVCDHLTSFAGAFDDPYQDKLCLWLAAGAAAAAGTVCEPYVIWQKFPHASFYVHYSRGYSVLASYMKAVANPYQLLMVGDALCRPYAKKLPHGVDTEVSEGHLKARIDRRGDNRLTLNRWMLDGEILETVDGTLEHTLLAGWHELRCRVQVAGEPAEVIELQSMIHVPDKSLEWEASIPLGGLTLNIEYPIDLSWQGTTAASSFRLMKGYRILAEAKPQGTQVQLRLNPKVLGLGPSRLHWEVGYEKGRVIRGPSSQVTVR